MRRQAKVINFGIIYGMGINALRQNLGTDRESAQKFYNEYFKKFAGLAEYLEKVKNETYKRGYTETFSAEEDILKDSIHRFHTFARRRKEWRLTPRFRERGRIL